MVIRLHVNTIGMLHIIHILDGYTRIHTLSLIKQEPRVAGTFYSGIELETSDIFRASRVVLYNDFQMVVALQYKGECYGTVLNISELKK